MSEQVTERKLTIKDLNTSYFMFEVFAQACCSYERLQHPDFLWYEECYREIIHRP